MSTQPDDAPKKSNAYEMFILVLTVLSLVVMVALLLPLNDATIKLLTIYDNAICVVFLLDFAMNLARSNPKRAYLVDRRGWLDLLGSIPALGVFRLTALLRLARLSRFARITRLLRGQSKKTLVQDVVAHRGQYAAFITVLAAFTVLTVSSVLVLQFEGRSPDANITTGGGALWWSIVTITTVGYGDEYPVTLMGRLVAVLVMFAGVGIIGALASILASILVPPAQTQEERDDDASAARTLQNELVEIQERVDRAPAIAGGRRERSAGRPGTDVMTSERGDVVVVGLGVTGLSTAAALARRGHTRRGHRPVGQRPPGHVLDRRVAFDPGRLRRRALRAARPGGVRRVAPPRGRAGRQAPASRAARSTWDRPPSSTRWRWRCARATCRSTSSTPAAFGRGSRRSRSAPRSARCSTRKRARCSPTPRCGR